jgi:hypothetical protein
MLSYKGDRGDSVKVTMLVRSKLDSCLEVGYWVWVCCHFTSVSTRKFLGELLKI